MPNCREGDNYMLPTCRDGSNNKRERTAPFLMRGCPITCCLAFVRGTVPTHAKRQIDRRALPADRAMHEQSHFLPPRNVVERGLANIHEVLAFAPIAA